MTSLLMHWKLKMLLVLPAHSALYVTALNYPIGGIRGMSARLIVCEVLNAIAESVVFEHILNIGVLDFS